MATEPTDVEKIQRLPWLIVGDGLSAGFALLTFSGSVFLLFLDQLGLNTGQIGFLLAIPPFCGILAPFVAPLVARHGYKRVFVTFWGVRKAVMALLLLTPLIQIRFGTEVMFFWVVGVIASFSVCRAIAETAGFPWRKEAIPDSIRGKFMALSNISMRVSGILVLAVASIVIGVGTGLTRFMILIAIGVVLGLASIVSFSRVAGGAPVQLLSTSQSHLKGMMEALRDKSFLYFLGALGLATVGGMSVISFIPLYMKDSIGLSESKVVLLAIATYLGAILSSYLWGWTADRYGSKPIMQSSLYLMLLLPVTWFLIPRYSWWSTPLAMLVALVAGVSTLAWQISWTNYLFVNATPADKRSPYMAVYYAWFGIISGVGPLLAGLILTMSRDLQTSWFIFTIDAYTPLFAMSLVLMVAAAITVSHLRADGARSVGNFAGLFLRGNPIAALKSLIQYNFARNEMARLATTESMGDSKNPLSANELVEALSDPSFHVRSEAVHSIGRLPPEPELVNALIKVLEGPESELSPVAARSLGRMGDPRAIPALRDALRSRYPLLRANGARALALVEDSDSVPFVLRAFNSERSSALRVAYASFLGRLRVSQAIPGLFALLHQAESEVLRGEICLALARIVGEEEYYLRRWRSLHSDFDTAAAQAVLEIQKSAQQSKMDSVDRLAGICARHFAEKDTAGGIGRLKQLAQLVANHLSPDSGLAYVLRHCAQDLATPEPIHIELVLLTLHSLDTALQAGGPENPDQPSPLNLASDKGSIAGKSPAVKPSS